MDTLEPDKVATVFLHNGQLKEWVAACAMLQIAQFVVDQTKDQLLKGFDFAEHFGFLLEDYPNLLYRLAENGVHLCEMSLYSMNSYQCVY